MALTVASVVIICIIGYGIFYIVMWHLRRRRLYELASKIEGPPALPIVGNGHMFVTNIEHFLMKSCEVINLYPSPCRVWFGPLLVIIVTDPEQISVICTSPKTLAKAKIYTDYAGPLFGTGLLTAPVSIWREHRKLIQPTFNPKIMNSFVKVFATQSKVFTDRIEQHLGGVEFEIFKPLSSCTLDMICETAIGVKVHSQKNGDSNFVEAINETLSSFVKRFFQFWWQPDFVFYRTKLGKAQRRNIKFLRDFTDDIIRMKKIKLLRRQSEPDNNEDEPIPRREAFLDHLMKLTQENPNFSDEALRDEVITMVIAGDHTTAITTSFAMLMLASHPDVQEKIYEELHEIFGNTDSEERPVTPEDLSKMKYLERVIKETMRLFPDTPFLLRHVSDECSIGKHTLPTGSTVAIGALSLQRNEKYWPDPLKFDPDRFSAEEIAKRSPYTFLGFSSGPRNCIGLSYAMMSMKTLLATILRRYILKKDKILPVKDIPLKYDFLLSPIDPITLRIEKRTTN